MRQKLHFFTGYNKIDLVRKLMSVGFNIELVVVPKTSKYRDQLSVFIESCQEVGIETLIASHRGGYSELVEPRQATSLLSVGFPLVLPMKIVKRYEYALNIHPTLLPRHRGKYLHYIILEGDRESGATAHLITEGVDSGPIVAQLRFPVSPFDTVASLWKKSKDLEFQLIDQAFQNLSTPGFSPSDQDESLATEHLQTRSPEDSIISNDATLIEALAIIRTCDVEQYPGFFMVNGEKICVKMWRPNKPITEIEMI